MQSLFNRTTTLLETSTERSSVDRKQVAAVVYPADAVLPEVTEGNLDSDWALWEDSVAFMDSQLDTSFNPLESVRERGEHRNDHADDPFTYVRKRGA